MHKEWWSYSIYWWRAKEGFTVPMAFDKLRVYFIRKEIKGRFIRKERRGRGSPLDEKSGHIIFKLYNRFLYAPFIIFRRCSFRFHSIHSLFILLEDKLCSIVDIKPNVVGQCNFQRLTYASRWCYFTESVIDK